MKATNFFALTIQQGKNRFKIYTTASNQEAAAQKVMEAESCPKSAIIKIEHWITPQQKRPIKTELGIYRAAVITADHIFYVNYLESDENSAVLMYDKSGTLISDNCHASNYLFELVTEKQNEILWQSAYHKRTATNLHNF